MRVFRRRSRLGYFALLALALQVALAFAHAHSHAYGAAAVSDLAQRAITYGMCRPGTESPCPAPAHHNDGSNCPICWSTSLASAAVLHAPPLLALPAHPAERQRPLRARLRLHGDAPVYFRARAPPHRVLI